MKRASREQGSAMLAWVLLCASAYAAGAGTNTGYALSATNTNGLFADGERVTVRFEWPATAAPPSLQFEAFDAGGQLVRRYKLRQAGSRATDVTIDPEGRRYLDLRLVDTRAPTNVLAARSVAILPVAVAQDRRFGLNATPEEATLARRLGACWVRQHIPWEQGGADQPLQSNAILRTVGHIRDAGCEVFGISSYSLPWASVYDAVNDKRPMRDFFSPPRPEPWDAYIRFAARQIRGQVPFFEVWNESNFDMFWRSTPDTFDQRMDDYAAMLKRSYAILKAEAPDVQVSNGSIVNSHNGNPHLFLERLIEKGCSNSFDVLNLHYYRANRPPDEDEPDAPPRMTLERYLQGFRDIQSKAGLHKPVWMTEIGWPTVDPGGWGSVTEIEQAAFLVRAHVLCFANGVEGVIWFQLQGREFGLISAEHGPRPACAAYTSLVRALRGRTFAGPVPAVGVRAFRFAGPEGDVIVAWSLTGTRWKLPAEFRIASAENVLGEPLRVSARRPIPLDGSPVFLFGTWTPAS